MMQDTHSNPEKSAGGKAPGSSIALLGLKHSGKSSVAALLARRLAIPCVDTDSLICSGSGCSSARKAYLEQGEAGFKELEFKACEAIARRAAEERMVIATGGGIADNEKALDRLGSCAVFIYLHESEDTLYERFMEGGRPAFLPAVNTREAWSRIYRRRERIYRRRAALTLECRGRGPADVTQEALDLIMSKRPTQST